MAAWPSIKNPDNGFEEDVYLPVVRTEFEGNYVQTRVRAGRERRRWNLSWNMMSETDYLLLDAFFLANQGISFTWTHPKTSASYTCFFSGDSLKSRLIITGWRSVQCSIEEV